MYSVFLTNSAEYELREIFNYISIELNARASAEKIVQKIEKKISSLREMPKFTKYKLNPTYYITHIGKYNILYVVDNNENKVIIAHIVYSKRKPQKF